MTDLPGGAGERCAQPRLTDGASGALLTPAEELYAELYTPAVEALTRQFVVENGEGLDPVASGVVEGGMERMRQLVIDRMESGGPGAIGREHTIADDFNKLVNTLGWMMQGAHPPALHINEHDVSVVTSEVLPAAVDQIYIALGAQQIPNRGDDLQGHTVTPANGGGLNITETWASISEGGPSVRFISFTPMPPEQRAEALMIEALL